MSQNSDVVIYGVFKAMGDLLCASPVIAQELRRGADVHLLLFPSEILLEFLDLIDFGANRTKLYVHFIPPSNSLCNWRRFFLEMKQIRPSRIWVSPHAPKESSSWKIPLVLRGLRELYWRKVPLAGADSEHSAFALTQKIPLDRSLPLIHREWDGYRMAFPVLQETLVPVQFRADLMDLTNNFPKLDLLIHPGANAKNRSWPVEKFAEVVQLLPASLRIGVVGVPSDIAQMRQVMPQSREIEYKSGTLAEAIAMIATTQVLLTMDSGNVHFAGVLKVPTVALFGKSDPINIIPLHDVVNAVYEKKFICQPCGRPVCSQPEVYCMNALMPSTVSIQIKRLLEKASQPQPLK